MILFAEVSGQELIIIIGMICTTVGSIFSAYFAAKYGATTGAKKAVEKNTEITIQKTNEILDKADEAATHAEAARRLAAQNASKNKIVAEKQNTLEAQVRALEEGSGLIRKKDHFKDSD